MASRMGPRSVKDATRFTSTIPHATSKAAQRTARIPGETPEQRVRRLRQAHLAAQHAQVSKTDRIIDASRRFFDVAHRWTVGSIVIFTAVAGVVSVYSVWDMVRYNRARRAEWVEAQKKLEDNELAMARLAYIKGEATEDQILLVEEANRAAEAKGEKLPPLLAAPEHRTHFEEHIKPSFQDKSEEAVAKPSSGKGVMGIFSGVLGSGDGKEVKEQSTSGHSNGQEVRLEAAKNARLTEAQAVQVGGPLDRLGVDPASGSAQGKSWWKFW
ncbi:cytochrome oxidase c assembly domain-containing protein [Fusarium heterosporum]|uniref:Cytochrome oxidase c assembly domain-containing protein n=1 Tax=Fusarium heterosporum TaxID=42747 RepID=A0A8H5TJD8_FUSHE|nr:cytochrome oxidase c assembly domain-containing protein [Fusarium heterosporum]